tara:strand:- start:473 stop:1621 length:1149 start_codon:yes stop_codon:yes gene_type:complete
MAGLFNQTQESYYRQSQATWSTNPNGTATVFTLTSAYFPTLSSLVESTIQVFINGNEIDPANYTFSQPTLTFTGRTNNETELAASTFAPLDGYTLLVKEKAGSERFGEYQYISLDNVVNNFLIAYVGEGKIIPKVRRTDVIFHAKRGLAEFSYDTLRSEKSQEIDVPSSLIIKLPHDYVNYVKLSYSDSNGIERRLFPTRLTSNPTTILQDSSYDYLFNEDGDLLKAEPSNTWTKYKASKNSSTSNANTGDDTDVEWRSNEGKRYGLTPEFAQDNGSFYIDQLLGRVHFSSNLNGKTLILKYISDNLGTDSEMRIHKFVEEALYKHIAYSIASTHITIPGGFIALFKKEKFAALRNAKIRLSNIKSEEMNLIMRNKSKQIKH